MFTRADKGNTVIALNRIDYVNKTLQFLDPKTYSIIKTDPTKKYQSEVNEIIKNSTCILDEKEVRKLTVMNPQAPKLYSLIKLHKADKRIRPVVSFVTAPSVLLSKKLIQILKEKCKFNSQFGIKNSLQFIDKVRDTQLNNCKLISFDEVNLFPSIPPKEVIKIVEQQLHKNKANPVEILEIINLLRICLNQDYFEINGNYYTGNNSGLIMGNPLSPLLAEIFMDSLENRIKVNYSQNLDIGIDT